MYPSDGIPGDNFDLFTAFEFSTKTAKKLRTYGLKGMDNDSATDTRDPGSSASRLRHPSCVIQGAEINPSSPPGIFHPLQVTCCRHDNAGAPRSVLFQNRDCVYPAYWIDKSAHDNPTDLGQNSGDIPYGARMLLTDAGYTALMADTNINTFPRKVAIINCLYDYGLICVDGQGQWRNIGGSIKSEMTVRLAHDVGRNVVTGVLDTTILGQIESALNIALNSGGLKFHTNVRTHKTPEVRHSDGLRYFGGGGPHRPEAINTAYDAGGTPVPPQTVTIVYTADDGALTDTGTITIDLVDAAPELPTFPRTIQVTNRTELNQALSGDFTGLTTTPASATGPLKARDMIRLANGGYGAGDLRVTSTVGIWVKANNNGMATFTGELEIAGNGNTFWGLKTSGNNARLKITGDDCTMQRCQITGVANAGANTGLITGKNARMLFCTISDISGRAVSIEPTVAWTKPLTPQAQRPLIWGCRFSSKKPVNALGEQAIRLGNSVVAGNSIVPTDPEPYGYPSAYLMRAYVGFNLFDSYNVKTGGTTDLEADTILNRCSGNKFVDNTFVDTNFLTGAAGNGNIYNQNWFESSSFPEASGISVAGDGATVAGNRCASSNAYITVRAGTQLNDLGRTAPQVAGAWDGTDDFPAANGTLISQNIALVRLGEKAVSTATIGVTGCTIDGHTGVIQTQVDYPGTWDTPTVGRLESGTEYDAELGSAVVPAARKIISSQVGHAAGWVTPPDTW
jgi:hypothetical protein